jgi:hypothetical protein
MMIRAVVVLLTVGCSASCSGTPTGPAEPLDPPGAAKASDPEGENYRHLTGAYADVGCGIVITEPDAAKDGAEWPPRAVAATFVLRFQ